ncbi:MAG: type II toxin-antitoxin system VapC family toxin [Candidatus Latescibacteria bacterium]|nr:type II toxin-antitoxin system VapC family toxin [Candidatus Latescibacterota bacterium]
MSKVFDSNILIYHLNGKLTETAQEMMEQAIGEGACISVITRIEILGWQGQSEEALRRTKNFLDQFEEQSLSAEIVDKCIALRQGRRLKIPDAIIAATALHLNLPLVTRNTEDFKGIEGLNFINPFVPG